MRRLSACGLILLGEWLLTTSSVAYASGHFLSNLPRDEDIVTVSGAQIAGLLGQPVSDITVFRYDGPTNSFVPIPFQVDQRVDHVFNPGTPNAVTETMYDVFGEDDGILDANDEVAFLFGDGGAQALTTTPWPAGSTPQRAETAVTDPRPDVGTTKFAYLFAGGDLAHSPSSYVTWDGGEYSSIQTGLFALDFTGRWLLTGLRVLPPCGTGADLVDRVKGRAGANPQLGETEETWNGTSWYLGGIAGPIRAIRYVQGAASGVNTVHHDVVSRSRWKRQVNLRVHPLTQVWLYFDLRPNSGATLFTAATPTGLPVDGVVDPTAPKPLQSWMLLRSSQGGFVTLPNVPPSPYYNTAESYIVDNAAYNDAPPVGVYPDDDNSAYGNHGITLKSLVGNETTTIPMTLNMYPLCSDLGDAALGAAYLQLTAYPLFGNTVPQWTVGGPVRTVECEVEGVDVVLDWDALPGVTGYKVYVALSPSLIHPSWIPIGQTASTHFHDENAAADEQSRYYSIRSVTPVGEGPW